MHSFGEGVPLWLPYVDQPAPRAPTADIPRYLGDLQRNLLHPLGCFECGQQTVTLKQRNAQGSQVTLGSFHFRSWFVSIRSSTFAGLWVFPGPAWQDVLLSRRVFSAEYSQHADTGKGSWEHGSAGGSHRRPGAVLGTRLRHMAAAARAGGAQRPTFLLPANACPKLSTVE